ncbi:hypothetical protein CKM354_000290100 [Cercospora kikuchii]|uniref:Major facilitator superfamily (MFS) profile domain-containing protein n=1 Tax=Cercospora kikuchii TaxID=84275 RepID=A0A9P3CGL4_9PEZI|nr:uncharacterized protein CKM354_000290100 [Cercospora kikuchii]GIZ39520.1 hypothetical protein CKM354_000290100 [Cercospora kikuchii]
MKNSAAMISDRDVDIVDEKQNKHALGDPDLLNQHAFKGDDSDGKVGWTFRKVLVISILSMLYTGSQLVLYFVGGSLNYIVADLNSPSVASWLPVANTLAIGAVCPFVGYTQDIFGKRWISIIGAVLLCVGCLLLALANSFAQAVAGMAIAGVGAGIGELTGLAGLAEAMPVKHRGYASAIITVFVFPFAPYVMYSELFCRNLSWRWAGWIPLIYNAATLVGLVALYHPKGHSRTSELPWKTVVKQIDYLGGILSTAGLTLLLVALQSGGYTHPWSSAFVLSMLIIGLLLLVVFTIWEWKFAPNPMIPHGLFQGQRTVALAFGVAFVAGMNFYSLLNFWPVTIKNVWGTAVVPIGLRGFAGALAVATGAVVFNAALSIWPGGPRYILGLAAVMLTCFGGALAVMTPENEIMSVAFGVLASLGLGGLIVPSATVAMIASPDAFITTCAALSLSVRAVGGSVGYSIFYAIFSDQLRTRLPQQLAAYAVGAGLPIDQLRPFVATYATLGPVQAAQLPGVTPQILAAAGLGKQWAYAESLHYLWYTTIGFGCLAILSAAFIPSLKRFASNRVAVAI